MTLSGRLERGVELDLHGGLWLGQRLHDAEVLLQDVRGYVLDVGAHALRSRQGDQPAAPLHLLADEPTKRVVADVLLGGRDRLTRWHAIVIVAELDHVLRGPQMLEEGPGGVRVLAPGGHQEAIDPTEGDAPAAG